LFCRRTSQPGHKKKKSRLFIRGLPFLIARWHFSIQILHLSYPECYAILLSFCARKTELSQGVKRYFDSPTTTAPLRNSFGKSLPRAQVKEFLCTLKQLSNSKFVNQLFILYFSYPLPRTLPRTRKLFLFNLVKAASLLDTIKRKEIVKILLAHLHKTFSSQMRQQKIQIRYMPLAAEHAP